MEAIQFQANRLRGLVIFVAAMAAALVIGGTLGYLTKGWTTSASQVTTVVPAKPVPVTVTPVLPPYGEHSSGVQQQQLAPFGEHSTGSAGSQVLRGVRSF